MRNRQSRAQGAWEPDNASPEAAPDPAMQALQMRYLAHVADRLEAFEPCAAPFSADNRTWLTGQAHALAGSGGSFGFWDISARAGELESLLKDSARPSDRDIGDHLTRLRDALATALLASETAELGEVPAARPQAVPVFPPAPVLSSRVVIVEDDVSVRDLLSGLISATAEVFTAADTAEGRRLVETVKPDLILLDNRIGGADAGLELLDSLQAVPGLKDIPVIMITASDDPGEVMRALMAGAADYIVKPFDPAEVGAKIRGRLDRLGSHVLIADDDDTVREMLVHKFQSAGCKVTAVQTGAEAWEALQAGDYSVALLDRMMPGYDGVTLLRMMKGDPHTAQVPVVFLTARHYGADVLEGLNTGAVDYITKPFHADEVLARVLRLLNSGEAA